MPPTALMAQHLNFRTIQRCPKDRLILPRGAGVEAAHLFHGEAQLPYEKDEQLRDLPCALRSSPNRLAG
jgi:hypothetical protein